MRAIPYLGLLLALQRAAAGSQQSKSNDFVCVHPVYKVHLISSSPLVIYIRDFLTDQEREHLRDVSEGHFKHSVVGGGKRGAGRTSESAYVARDAVVECIEERALAFQGYDIPSSHLEPLQLVRYSPGEQYHLHNDWYADPAYSRAASGGNRASSFFAYVHVRNDTTGGGTNFPLINAPTDERWCEIVDCDEPWERGITFRPVQGNAIYWENLRPEDGTGDPGHCMLDCR
ncbi:putative prolyl 4-hydroxylase 4 [Madurella mycetomatis]|uniref:Prolyl 4-hydroxylase 4 n=1 Tax=Madurella mycetomatis TaxID=100816 RepID=A0A175W2J2_9PEZI|nr:putative prolyl 4-hydroxylase 4 [Madurella mycetomatis]